MIPETIVLNPINNTAEAMKIIGAYFIPSFAFLSVKTPINRLESNAFPKSSIKEMFCMKSGVIDSCELRKPNFVVPSIAGCPV